MTRFADITFLKTLLSVCMFGLYLLALIMLTYIWNIPFRYDVLFVAAIGMQIVLVVRKLEHREEVYAITLFHLLGTCMELFKTSVGSWSYSEVGFFSIGAVPLFAGFMYASVGSAIARGIRLFRVHFTDLPGKASLLLLGGLIYMNFFTHHYMYDIRYILLAYAGVLLYKTHAHITVGARVFRVHFLAVALCVATCIWIAENVATYAHIWRYPHQILAWRPVHAEKITSWFLLMLVSFTLVIAARKHPHSL